MSDLSTSPTPTPSDDQVARYRSAAVARMVRMPVATLRIWERRYRVAAPQTTPSGHRLYCAADIQRLVLLKQLTELGHAIGSIANLDMAQLREVARTHASTMATPRGAPAVVALPQPAWRCVLVGAALGLRLRRAALQRELGRPLQIVLQVETLADLPATVPPGVDLLLVQQAGVHPSSLEALTRAAQALRAAQVGLLYGYAAEASLVPMAAAGVAVLREPVTDADLARWLRSLCPPPPLTPAAGDDSGLLPGAQAAGWQAQQGLSAVVPPRRYDDNTLADFAGLSSTIACECPQHVAELVMQLSRFEAYSRECANRDARDAELHGYLQQVAGTARALFESALERVAIREGLVLPR